MRVKRVEWTLEPGAAVEWSHSWLAANAEQKPEISMIGVNHCHLGVLCNSSIAEPRNTEVLEPFLLANLCFRYNGSIITCALCILLSVFRWMPEQEKSSSQSRYEHSQESKGFPTSATHSSLCPLSMAAIGLLFVTLTIYIYFLT